MPIFDVEPRVDCLCCKETDGDGMMSMIRWTWVTSSSAKWSSVVLYSFVMRSELPGSLEQLKMHSKMALCSASMLSYCKTKLVDGYNYASSCGGKRRRT